MREIKLSWLSKENWDKAIEDGFLPILAVFKPRRFWKTPIHFPELSPKKYETEDLEEAKDLYWNDLTEVDIRRIYHKFDVLAHLASSSGIMIFTCPEKDPFREVLGQYLSTTLGQEI